MPEQKIILRPGVTTEATQTLAMGTWSRSNLIRWRDGFLEKQLGWSHLSSEAVLGTARSMHTWQDLDNIKYLAIGTNSHLQLFSSNGALVDITPLRDTVNITVQFSTDTGSPTVNIRQIAHGASSGDVINIVTAVSVGGLILLGFYTVSYVDADNYQITAASNATSNVVNGGAVSVFDTTNTSNEVSVTLADHGLSVGDPYDVPISVSVGGLTITGTYLVDSVTDADTFVILADSGATSTATASINSGDVRIKFLIYPGLVSDSYLTGWGAGTWGQGEWGQSSASLAVQYARIWALDNFSTDLLAAPSNGPLYKWTPPIAFNNEATLVTGDPPLYMTTMFVAMPQLQAVALGAEVLGNQDPMLVRFSDVGDYTVWTATSTNQAGSYRLSRGSRIVGGLQGPQAGLIWTDVSLWQMQYVGLPFVYSFTMLAQGCGLVGPNAMGQVDRQIYWMSTQGFYVYGTGTVTPVPCAVYDTIFQDLDINNLDKIVAAPSSTQREIAWYYPSASGGTGEVDKYVKLNTLSGEWDYGDLVRTAWIDQNIFGAPIGIDGDGIIQQHDMGYNADGSAMVGVMAETGFVDLSEGAEMVFLDQFIPDFKLLGTDPQLTLYIKTVTYPNATPVEFGPYTVDASTEFITVRARARQMSVRIECDAIDTWFRLGATRARIAPAGRVP